MIFCISILGKDAVVMAGYGRVWISGTVMNRMITVKIKFVYVETINHKAGWTARRCLRGQADDMMAKLPGWGDDAALTPQKTYNYDVPIPFESNDDCRSTTSKNSSCQSSIADPFDVNDDGTSAEPIHVGDEIEFFKSPFVFGDQRGLVRATVLSIDPEDSCPLVLSNQIAIAKDGFQND